MVKPSLSIERDSEIAMSPTKDASSAPSSNPDPSIDFQGDIPVSNDLPNQENIEKCANLSVLDANGESRPFKSLYSGEGVATRQLIIFVRHFFCGVRIAHCS